jgi:hypothetical protein
MLTVGFAIKFSFTVNVMVITSHTFANDVFELLEVIVVDHVNSGGTLSIQVTVARDSQVLPATSWNSNK